MSSTQHADGAFAAAMDLDTSPRVRLVFDDEEDEILELGAPRPPRQLSDLYSPPTPRISPDPEEQARRAARATIRGD